MDDDVLFVITKDKLETGLRDFPIGYCPTSSVSPDQGLFYVGHPIPELIDWEPERVIFLLHNGYDGEPQELDAFKQQLIERAHVPKEVIAQIRNLPRMGHPMTLFATAALILGMYVSTKNYQEDCLNLIAKIPEVAAAVICHHAGWECKPSKPELGYMQNFAQMLNAPGVDQNFPDILRLFNILHFDHGGGNLTTFVGKAVASGHEDMYGSFSASMCALAGNLHGGANQETLHFVSEILKTLGDNATEDDLERLVRDKLAKKQLIFGFGHAVLRVEDPRATIQYAFAEKHYPKHPLVRTALMLRKVGPKVLKENPKIANPYTNIDAISGTLLTAAGFHYPEYYTVLFGLSRAVGTAIQIVYERVYARNGKGTPIVRPEYFYRPRSLT